MEIFKINKDTNIVCETKSTRNGFKHEATLIINNLREDKAKVTYINRTWEAFRYQTILRKLIQKTDLLTDRQKKLAIAKLRL